MLLCLVCYGYRLYKSVTRSAVELFFKLAVFVFVMLLFVILLLFSLHFIHV